MSREAFEKWASDKTFLIKAGDDYINVKQMAWEAWQAALESQQEDAVAVVGENQILEWLPPYAWQEVGTKLYARATNQPISNAAADILAERKRQVEVEGWTAEHDDGWYEGELAAAAGCYIMYGLDYPEATPPPEWPWDPEWWKPSDQRRNYIKAGALIIAEIERLDRESQQGGGK